MSNFNHLITLAAETRKELGGKAYLLDTYLSMHLKKTQFQLDPMHTRNGAKEANTLLKICRGICREDGSYAEEFYPEAIIAMKSHPMDFQEIYTKEPYCFTVLAGDYLDAALVSYADAVQEKHIRIVIDKVEFEEVTQTVKGLIGGEKMVDFERMLANIFLPTDAMKQYQCGFLISLINHLLYRDWETQKQIFQLFLDEYAAK